MIRSVGNDVIRFSPWGHDDKDGHYEAIKNELAQIPTILSKVLL